MNRRVFAVTIALVAALAACGGDDDAAIETAAPTPTATSTSAEPPVTTDPPTTSAPSTTAPPTTAAPTTTIPPIAALTIEQLGDLPGCGVERVLNAARTIIAVAEVEDPDNMVNYSLLRIDPATSSTAPSKPDRCGSSAEFAPLTRPPSPSTPASSLRTSSPRAATAMSDHR